MRDLLPLSSRVPWRARGWRPSPTSVDTARRSCRGSAPRFRPIADRCPFARLGSPAASAGRPRHTRRKKKQIRLRAIQRAPIIYYECYCRTDCSSFFFFFYPSMIFLSLVYNTTYWRPFFIYEWKYKWIFFNNFQLSVFNKILSIWKFLTLNIPLCKKMLQFIWITFQTQETHQSIKMRKKVSSSIERVVPTQTYINWVRKPRAKQVPIR